MKPLVAAFALTFAAPIFTGSVFAAQGAHPFDVHDLVMMDRVSDPALSPDGKVVAFQVRETDYDANKGTNGVWIVPSGGGKSTRLTDKALNATSPRWATDGSVYFLAPKDGISQLWRVGANGGAAQAATSLPLDVNNFKFSPDGKRVLLSVDVFTDCGDLACTKKKLDERKANKASGTVYDTIFIRHWDTWADGTRSQLFVVPLSKQNGDSTPLVGKLIGDTPSKPFGGGEEVAWSADGRTVFFALREAGRIEPTSTNLDIFSVPADGSAQPTNLTPDNDGTDNLPTVSPDGKWLAWVSMKRPGYEADRLVLQLRNLATGETRAVTEAWDRSVDSIAWTPDSKKIIVCAGDTQEVPAFEVDPKNGKVTRLTQEGAVSAVVPVKGGMVYAMNSLLSPDDFYLLKGKTSTRLTSVNAAKMAGIDLPKVERFSFTA